MCVLMVKEMKSEPHSAEDTADVLGYHYQLANNFFIYSIFHEIFYIYTSHI